MNNFSVKLILISAHLIYLLGCVSNDESSTNANTNTNTNQSSSSYISDTEDDFMRMVVDYDFYTQGYSKPFSDISFENKTDCN